MAYTIPTIVIQIVFVLSNQMAIINNSIDIKTKSVKIKMTYRLMFCKDIKIILSNVFWGCRPLVRYVSLWRIVEGAFSSAGNNPLYRNCRVSASLGDVV